MRFAFAVVLVALLPGCADKSAPTIADIHGLALDPVVQGRLYVATHHGLFVGGPDGSWKTVTGEPFDMMGFTMHPRDPQIMYASGHPGRAAPGDWAVGLVKSIDGGRTWTEVGLRNQVDFHALALEPGTEDRIYGFHRGQLWTSSDSGRSWNRTNLPFNVNALAVDAPTGDVLAATDRGLQRASRAGSWQVLVPDVAHAVAVALTTGGRLAAYFEDDGLRSSFDRGTTWSSLNWTAAPDDYVWGVAVDPRDPAIVYTGTARGQIHRTTDGGASWSRMV